MQSDAYRGEDRRLAAGARTTMSRREMVVGAAIVLLAGAAGSLLPLGQGVAIAPLLAAAAAAAAARGVVVGTLCLARWLIAGEAPALLLGAAAPVYGVVLVGILELIPQATTERLRPAAVVTVLGLLGAAVAVPRIDTRVRPLTVFGGGLAAMAALTAVPALPLGRGFLALGAAALAVVYGLRGWRHGHWLFASFALLLLAIATAEVPVASLAGLGLALRGALRQLLVDYRDQSASLLSTRVSLATAENRIRASRERAEERAHEARSALAAIEGASSTLERHRDRLPAQTRAQLLDAVKGEIRRLQRLVDPASERVRPFAVDGLLAPIIAAERARGTRLNTLVPAGLLALGRQEATADVLRCLLDNARRYAPGPVTIRASANSGRVLLRVDDRGPGVPPSEREAIFGRGTRGSAGNGIAGSGLGLAIAAELARDQHGRLWVDDREGGGASFALDLPEASAVLADGGEHGGERVEEDLSSLPPDQHATHARVGSAGQPHDDPRPNPARG